jgi:hypothetical protein
MNPESKRRIHYAGLAGQTPDTESIEGEGER